MGSTKSSCVSAKGIAPARPCRKCGAGSPIMCPIETYISGAKNASETISRVFMLFSSASTGSGPSAFAFSVFAPMGFAP